MFLITVTVMNQTICLKIWEVFSDCRIFSSCFAPQSGGWWRLHGPVRVQTPTQPRLWVETNLTQSAQCGASALYVFWDFFTYIIQKIFHWSKFSKMTIETHGLLDSQLLTESGDLSLSVLLCIGNFYFINRDLIQSTGNSLSGGL